MWPLLKLLFLALALPFLLFIVSAVAEILDAGGANVGA